MIKKMILPVLLLILGCVRIPENVVPVEGFELDKYLGIWYEIARLDHSFERGLINVSAEYSMRDDGGIKVVNKGFDPKNNRWKETIGKAYFIDDSNIGRLKVSFLGPFYGAYNIIDLDKGSYSYSLVCGPNKSYLWILAREPHMEESLKTKLVTKAKDLGFETEKMIFVSH